MAEFIEVHEDTVSPVWAYLSRSAPGSRQAQLSRLDAIARYITNGKLQAEEYQWELVDYKVAAQVRAWIVRKYKPASGRAMMAAFHEVIRMCWRLELIDQDRMMRVCDTSPVRGKGPRPGRALRVDELHALARSFSSSISGTRNRSMVSMMHSCGLRVVELVRLRVVDVNFHDREVMVNGKGARLRLVPMSDLVETDLDRWLDVRGRRNGPLYPVVYGVRKNEPLKRLSNRSVTKVVVEAAERAGIQRITPHDLRRTFVTRLLDAGVDVATAGDLAGHESLDTTRLYDRRGAERARAAVDLVEW